MGVPNSSGSAAFAPFEAWSEWLRNNMGAMSASPGSNGKEEAEAVPEGATASDPLMSAMGELSDANPMSNIIPINWIEISKALQTLHKRQMSFIPGVPSGGREDFSSQCSLPPLTR
jgi:hypothetical protein